MLFEGNPQVFSNLRLKRDLLAKGDSRHERYRTALGVGGGALLGTYGAGQLSSLAQYGHVDTFDVALTASTGTPATLFFVSGQVDEARSIYWKECVTSRFLSLRRLIARAIPGNQHLFAMDIDYLADVFRGENDRGLCLDIETFRRARTEFYAAVTSEHGKTALIDMRRAEDPIEAMKASIAIPGISRGNVRLGDELYFDGMGAVPFPPTQLIDQFAPTDVLFLANCPKPRGIGTPVPSAYLKDLPSGARKMFETYHERFATELAVLRARTDCRWAIIWTDDLIDPFERNAKKLEDASHRAKAHLDELLSQQVLSLTA
jgi:predicted acylesterase/phospholipase RssA